MTKSFYVERNLPKNRPTEAEMLEINDRYRVIGRWLTRLRTMKAPAQGVLEGRAASKDPNEKLLWMTTSGSVGRPASEGADAAGWRDSPWALGGPAAVWALGIVFLKYWRSQH